MFCNHVLFYNPSYITVENPDFESKYFSVRLPLAVEFPRISGLIKDIPVIGVILRFDSRPDFAS